MINSKFKFRTRYSEVDQMGFVYYGHYATYFEVARVELFREIGISYKQLENNNILLPVSEYKIKYLKPIFYDEEFIINTMLKKIPLASRIHFEYEIINSQNKKTTIAETTLFFMNKISNKPIKCPEYILKKLNKYF